MYETQMLISEMMTLCLEMPVMKYETWMLILEIKVLYSEMAVMRLGMQAVKPEMRMTIIE
jgi:hypothetical protein